RNLIIPIFFIGLFAACEKDLTLDRTNNPPFPEITKKNTDAWIEASNPLNPFEYLEMGAYHNNALNFCRDRKNNYNSPQEWFAGIDKDIIDFFCTETDFNLLRSNCKYGNSLGNNQNCTFRFII